MPGLIYGVDLTKRKGLKMNVILLESVENLGGIGDLVKVKPGYGRNYLLPQGKAALATAANMKKIEARRAELEKATSPRHLRRFRLRSSAAKFACRTVQFIHSAISRSVCTCTPRLTRKSRFESSRPNNRLG